MAKRGHNSAVVDGQLRHFSVSQIRDFLRCPRLWWAGKVLGLRSPRKPGAERGTDLHQQPEAYYLHGTLATHEGFLAALPGLPGRHPELRVELPLEDPTLYVDDVRLEGYSDLMVPPHVSVYGIPEVLDWKFVSSFRYMEDPANDLQCLLYGYWASRKWPQFRHVRLALHYFLADGSDFTTRAATVPVERCESEWEDIVIPAVRRMAALAAESPTPEYDKVLDNRGDACYKYGGCFLMERCGVVSKGAANRANQRILEDFDYELARKAG